MKATPFQILLIVAWFILGCCFCGGCERKLADDITEKIENGRSE